MAEPLLDATPADRPPAAPRLAWPVAVDADQALRTVTSRLGPGAAGGADVDLSARMVLHPMLAVEFVWHRRRREGAAHALVDLVGGRAFVVEPWTEVPFVPVGEMAELEETAELEPPAPQVPVEEAVRTARQLLAGVLLRRRRLGSASAFELRREPLCVGKPNWWVSGTAAGRRVEVIVDAVSGRHYAFQG